MMATGFFPPLFVNHVISVPLMYSRVDTTGSSLASLRTALNDSATFDVITL